MIEGSCYHLTSSSVALLLEVDSVATVGSSIKNETLERKNIKIFWHNIANTNFQNKKQKIVIKQSQTCLFYCGK